MSATLTFTCACPDARLGIIDGDNSTIHCGNCEGVLGSLEDIFAAPVKQIEVKKVFTFAQPITVQFRTGDGDLEDCTHSGAEMEALEYTVHSSYDGGAYSAPDDSQVENLLVCDKDNCKAWLGADNVWHNDN